MKNIKIQITCTLLTLLAIAWLISRPCSLRPFQDKNCWQCGVEEGEQMAIRDWNKRHPAGDPYNYDSLMNKK